MGIFKDWNQNRKEKELRRKEIVYTSRARTNGTYHGTKEEQEKIKQMVKSEILRKTKKKLAIAGVTFSCVAAGILGATLGGNKENIAESNITTISTEGIKTDEEIVEQTLAQNQEIERIDGLHSKKETLNYLKEMYVAEYNNRNDTTYSIKDINFFSNDQSYVWLGQEDDRYYYVTHGATPDVLENKLEKEDKNFDKIEDVKVYTSMLVTEEGKKSLESIAIHGNEIVPVILGDDYLEGKGLSISENQSTLQDMGDLMIATVDLVTNFENDGIAKSKKEANEAIYKEKMKEAVKVFYEKRIEKGQER